MSEKEIDSVNDLFASLTANAPLPEATKKGAVAPMSVSDVAKIVPELVSGLVDPATGEAWPGARLLRDTEEKLNSDGTGTGRGKLGPLGAVYVVRPFVYVTPALAQFTLQNFGQANRDSTKSRLEAYADAMTHDEWSFVFNTAIFTVDIAGQLTSIGIEQHNGAHQMKTSVATGCGLEMMFCFGVPRSERDKIDDNQARSAKDIVTSRAEMKEIFAVNSVIGGAVVVTPALANTMMKNVSETFRIIESIRNGKAAKTGGTLGMSKSDVGHKLDLYAPVIGKAVSNVVALNSRLETSDVNKEGIVKQKTSGGLSKRVSTSHASAVVTLGAAYHRADGTFGYDDRCGTKILTCLAELGNEKMHDVRRPMVSLRNAIDKWNADKKHKGSDGMNVRFIALKTAIIWTLSGGTIHNQSIWDSIRSQDGGTLKLGGLGSNPDAVGGIVGIDDYVDAVAAALEADMTEPTSDTPTDFIPETDE